MNPDAALPESETVEPLIRTLHEVSYMAVVTAALALHADGYVSPLLLSTVIEGLSHSCSEVRRSAIITLQTVGQGAPVAAHAVLSALEDRDADVRFHAVCCLGELGYASPETIRALIPLTRSQNSSMRYAAIRTLSKIGPNRPEVVDVLISALSDTDEWVCKQAIQGLIGVTPRSPRIYAILIEALDHRLYEVFGPAREALRPSVYTDSEEAMEATLSGLRHANWKIRRSVVIDVLGAAGPGPERVVRALLERLKDADQNVYNYVPTSLAVAGKESTELLPALLRLMQDRRQEIDVRCRAIETLKLLERGTPEVIEALIAALHEKGLRRWDAWSLRFSAVEALGTLGKGNPEVAEALLPLLPEDTNLHSVATALAEVAPGSPEVARRLIAVVNGLSMEKQSIHPFSPECVRALGRVGIPSPEGVLALRRAMQHSEPAVRTAAAEALGTLGKGSLEATNLLIPALQDVLPATRKAAAASLGAIGIINREILTALFAALADFQGPHAEVLEAWRQFSTRSAEPMKVALAALQDPEVSRRTAAVQALGACAAEYPEALQALHVAEDDPSEHVQAAARKTLHGLGVRPVSSPKPHRTLIPLREQPQPSPEPKVTFVQPQQEPAVRPEAKYLKESLEAIVADIRRQQEAIHVYIKQALEEVEPITEGHVNRLTDALRHQMMLVRASVARALELPIQDASRLNAVLRDRNPDTRQGVVEAVYAIIGDQPDRASALMESFAKYYWWFYVL